MRALQFFTPEEFALEKEWLKIRDMLLGDNYTEQNVEQALHLATQCQHKHAQYLTRIFKDKEVTTKQEARKVFLSQPPDDAIALCFSEIVGLCRVDYNYTRIKRSADFGFIYAFSFLSEDWEGEKQFAQRERSGFLWRARFFYEKGNQVLARNLYEIAAEIGCTQSMIEIGIRFNRDDPTVWIWFGKSFSAKNYQPFLAYSLDYINLLFKHGKAQNPCCIFQIGRTLKQRTDLDKRTVCERILPRGYDFNVAVFAIEHYNRQLRNYRKAVDAWSCVALRNRVCKDIRILIGKYIWRTREEALY